MENPRPLIIYPVILAVPDKEKRFPVKERVIFLSKYARSALKISAQKQRIPLGDLLKDGNGVPVPFNGNYWSLTHKPDYVGGVIATTRIGIDIEKIRPCSEALLRKTVDDREWRLSDAEPIQLFFRYWTSKESVLKASGIGIRDLLKCRIAQVKDDYNLIIAYREKKWHVEHFYFDGHIASVVKNRFQVDWTLLDKNHLQKS
jgi:4'-phosphopantetheinyl transferase